MDTHTNTHISRLMPRPTTHSHGTPPTRRHRETTPVPSVLAGGAGGTVKERKQKPLANALASLRHAAALDGRPDFRSPCRRPPRRRLRTTRRSALLLPYFKMLIAYDQEPAQAGCQLHADARRGHAVEELAPGRPASNGRREFESFRPRRRQDRLLHVGATGHWAPGCMLPPPPARCPRTCARTIARTCCRKLARARARPNAHCPRPHTRPHKGDRGSRSGGRRRRGRRADAERRREQSSGAEAGAGGNAGESDACVWPPARLWPTRVSDRQSASEVDPPRAWRQQQSREGQRRGPAAAAAATECAALHAT